MFAPLDRGRVFGNVVNFGSRSPSSSFVVIIVMVVVGTSIASYRSVGMHWVVRESCNLRVTVIENFDLGEVMLVLKFGSAVLIAVWLLLLEATVIVRRVRAVLVSARWMAAVVRLQVLAPLATTATITVLLLLRISQASATHVRLLMVPTSAV